ncbi:MAG: DUF2683 family protein [Candidatus Diapherotrites archaeon]|nr:DUF2683 family protein [Candidatus Diapherotrites archaeon]
MGKSVSMNLKVRDYTSRVLGVVKEKYGLKDKGSALDKFAELFGEEFVDEEIREEVIKEVIESCNRHMKKYGFRSRSVEDLRKLIEEE